MAERRSSLRIALMLETDGPGGAENVVFDLAEALRDRGHSVFPLVPKHGDGWLGEKLRASGFETPMFDLRTHSNPIVIRDLRLIRDLTRIFKRLDVDVVHCHDFVAAVHGGIAARLAGKPRVLSMHGNQTMCDAWRRRAALRWAFRHSHAAVAVSQATKAQLDRDLGLMPDAIQVIRNGVPPRTGRGDGIREELGVREGEIMILAVGNFVERKGHIYLLRALQSLTREGLSAPWRLAIAGGWGGEERPKLEAFAMENNLSDRVHLLTYRNDVPDLLAAADIFVMPSLWEGLPLAVLEALQMGVCVVASETSGIPEAIINEKHGLLVPPGDTAALAHSLGRVIRDSKLRDRLAAEGQARAMREFTIDAMASAYEAIYYAASPKMTNSLKTLKHIGRKLSYTLRNFKKTAYSYYGDKPSSMILYVYYGLFRVNTFSIFECDLQKDISEPNLDPAFSVLLPTIDELDRLRKNKDLPREFFYDQIHDAKNCCLALFDEEIAYIHWLYFRGDYSRFLILEDSTCEINYFFTLPKYRGRGLSSKMLAHSTRYLRERGYKKAVVVVHQNNVSFIKNIQNLPFQETRRIKTFGPFNRKVVV